MRSSYHSTDMDKSDDLEALGYQSSSESVSPGNAATSLLRKNWIALGLLCGIVFVAYDSIHLNKRNSGPMMTPAISLIQESTATATATAEVDSYIPIPLGELSIVASNEYGVFRGQYTFFEDYPGSQLIEPFKETTITLQGRMVGSNEYTFQWQLANGTPSPVSGNTLTLSVANAGFYDFSILAYDSKGQYAGTFSTTLISKYVKRELRSLTVADRERFLDAAHTMWQYSTEEGRELYGEKFTGIHTFVKEHAIASEDIMCDQFHEGSGFLTHHLALHNSFEASLRAVDASVTLPYWDFSIEGQMIVDAEQTPSHLLSISPVFTETWFGEVDENSHIKNGRWAHSAMPAVNEHDDASTTPHNSYGYFRSYWNNNPDPEVVRHLFDVCGLEDLQKHIPSCSAHFAVINASTLADFQTLAPGDGHGPLHVQTGGVFGGCTVAYQKFNDKWGEYLDTDVTEEEIEAGGLEVTSFMNKWGTSGQRRAMFNQAIMGEYFHIYRGLWRSHMCAADGQPYALQCPEKCEASTDQEEQQECGCSVPALAEGKMDWTNLYGCMLSTSNQDFFNGVMSEEFLKDMTHMVAGSSVKEGEMLHSGSPSDIMFWIIHPVIERLMAAKRSRGVANMGGTPFVKWDSSVEEDSSNWLSYSYYNLEEGANAFHPEAYTCVGHSAEDTALPARLPYTDAILTGGIDRNHDGQISNWEFFLALDPNNVHANDYVFDNFEWNHCEGKVNLATLE